MHRTTVLLVTAALATPVSWACDDVRTEPEAEAEATGDADRGGEAEAEAAGDADRGGEAEAEADAEVGAEAEAAADADVGPEAEAVADADAGPEAEAVADADAGPEAEAVADADVGPEADAEAAADDGADADTDGPPVVTVDPSATAETRALMERLLALAPSHLMFGAESATLLGHFMRRGDGSVDWDAADGTRSDVRDICGRHPAVHGFDASSVTGDWWIGNPDRESLMAAHQDLYRRRMREIHARGGLIVTCWHQHNPVTGEPYDAGPHELWRIVPPEACPGVVAEVPGLTDCGSHHDVFREKIDELADFFATLADADGDPIPVLFRPFHENNGSWFWWGEGGIDAHRYRVVFRAVWSWMVGYMSEVRDVHQLLWVISPNGGFDMGSEEDYLGHIPGLELVDVLGYDFYAVDFRPGEDPWWGELALGELSVVVRLAEANGKVPAMTEGGTPGGSADGWPADVWSGRLLGPILGDPTARRIAWFQAWANFPPDGPFWGPYLAHPSADDFRSLCDDGRISLEGDLPLY